MERGLAFISVAFAVASVLLAVGIRLYDRKHGSDLVHKRHGNRSPLSMSLSGMAVMGLLYAAIAFSQDLALEWLAAIALFCFFVASAVDRVVTARLAKLRTAMAEAGDAAEDTDGDGIPDSEPIPVIATEMLAIICDVVAWVTAIDLVVLFGLSLVENVIPYYVGLVIA